MKPVEVETVAVPDRYGRPFIYARVPTVPRRFHSPLHDVANMPPRLSGWRAELGHCLAGRMPFARLVEESSDPDAEAALRYAVIGALEQGFSGGVAIGMPGTATGRIAMPDAITDTVDLEALRHDWLAWLRAADVLDYDARVAVTYAIEQLGMSAYASYTWSLPEMVAEDPAQAIQYGIVVGDDPAMTCAAVLRALTGDHRFWEPVERPSSHGAR